MQRSENLNLVIPEINDQADITAFNENWEIMDSKIKETTDSIESTILRLDNYMTDDEISLKIEEIAESFKKLFISIEDFNQFKETIDSLPLNYLSKDDIESVYQELLKLAENVFVKKGEVYDKYVSKEDFEMYNKIVRNSIRDFSELTSNLSLQKRVNLPPNVFEREIFYTHPLFNYLEPISIIDYQKDKDTDNLENGEKVYTYKLKKGGLFVLENITEKTEYGKVKIRIDEQEPFYLYFSNQGDMKAFYSINTNQDGYINHVFSIHFSKSIEITFYNDELYNPLLRGLVYQHHIDRKYDSTIYKYEIENIDNGISLFLEEKSTLIRPLCISRNQSSNTEEDTPIVFSYDFPFQNEMTIIQKLEISDRQKINNNSTLQGFIIDGIAFSSLFQLHINDERSFAGLEKITLYYQKESFIEEVNMDEVMKNYE